MPELTILVKGIAIASRSVFFTLVLLSVIVFVFAVGFRQLTDGTSIGKTYFLSVPVSMANLFLYGALPDMVDYVKDVSGESLILGFVLIVFFFLAALTVMNMLVGILCDVVSVVSAVEKEQLQVMSVKRKLLHMLALSGIDANEDMQISQSQFRELLTNPKAAKAIEEVGVDAVALVDYGDIFFDGQNKYVSFCEFIQVMMQFRGTNSATVKDIVDLHKVIKRENEHLLDILLPNRHELKDESLPIHEFTSLRRGNTSALD